MRAVVLMTVVITSFACCFCGWLSENTWKQVFRQPLLEKNIVIHIPPSLTPTPSPWPGGNGPGGSRSGGSDYGESGPPVENEPEKATRFPFITPQILPSVTPSPPLTPELPIMGSPSPITTTPALPTSLPTTTPTPQPSDDDDDDDGEDDNLPLPIVLSTIFFGQEQFQVMEEEETAVITLTLAAPFSTPITLTYRTESQTAIENEDYISRNETLIFNPNQTHLTFTISMIDDLLIEAEPKTFNVILDPLSPMVLGSPGSATVMIHSGDGLVVNSPDDNDDGGCTVSHCSLREAIHTANANPGLNTIQFNIPGEGPHTITPTTALPQLTEPVIIDGSSQPGSRCGELWDQQVPELNIKLVGDDISGDGLTVVASQSTIKGLLITGFENGIHLSSDNNIVECNHLQKNLEAAILIQTDHNLIGGETPGAGNIISKNRFGIILTDTNATQNSIIGNFVGTDETGTLRQSNDNDGILLLKAPRNLIKHNLISSNLKDGISIKNPEAEGNIIQGNFIGTDITGTQFLRNRDGIQIIDAPNNLIGGPDAADRNLISGNDLLGIWITGATAISNVIQGNYIGTDVHGLQSVANKEDGIQLTTQAPNTILGNLISGNDDHGLSIRNGANTTIAGNYIGTDHTGTASLPNKGYGIHLVNTSDNTIGIVGKPNKIAHNKWGIFIQGGNNNLIQANEIYGHNKEGIQIKVGDNNDIWDNIIYDNLQVGFEIKTGNNNYLWNNDIYNNGTEGIRINIGIGNHFHRNEIYNNGLEGIVLNSGVNDSQAFPELTQVITSTSQITVTGILTSTPTTTYTIEFFANTSCDPSGYGEGEQFLDEGIITTDLTGSIPFTHSMTISNSSNFITTLVTDPAGNSSSFSPCFPAP